MEDGKGLEGLTRRDFLTLAGMGVAGMALAGQSDSYGAEKKPKYGGRLRVGYRYNASGLDAHRNQDFAEYTNYCLMYGALTEQGKLPQVELHPILHFPNRRPFLISEGLGHGRFPLPFIFCSFYPYPFRHGV